MASPTEHMPGTTEHPAGPAQCGPGPSEAFFERLSLSGRAPMPETATGSVRFQLVGDRGCRDWRVVIDQGDVQVSHDRAQASCTVRADQELFDEVVTGRANAMTALLRGALSVEGNPEALVLVQRLFPGPRGGPGPLEAPDRLDESASTPGGRL